MEIHQREESNVTILEIIGEIDLYNSQEIRHVLQDLASKADARVLMNLARVNFIDSSGIGSLIAGATALQKAKGRLCLVNLQSPVKRVLEITAVNTFFEIHDAEASALASLASN